MRDVVAVLALPAVEAIAHLSADPRAPDTLAFRFDEAYTAFVGALSSLPDEAQLLSLQALDSELCALSGTDDRDLWTSAAYVADPRWEEVRSLAAAAMRAFDW
jgi:hypothetical protein